MITEIQPGTVVAGKNDQGIFIQSFFFQCLHDLTNIVIHFLDHIPIHSLLALSTKCRRCIDGHMRHGIGDIGKKWFVFVFPDELDGCIREPSCQCCLIFQGLDGIDGPVIFNQRKGWILTFIAA